MQGLLARAIEQHPAAKPMQIVRFTCDLWRAAPFAPVTLRVRTLREGKSAEWLEAELCTGDEVAARASALRLRVEDVAAPPDRMPCATGALEDASPAVRWLGAPAEGEGPSDFINSIELRPVDGFVRPAAWLRLRVPLVAGERNEPVRLRRDALRHGVQPADRARRAARRAVRAAAVRGDQRRHVAPAAPRAGRRVDRPRRRGLLRARRRGPRPRDASPTSTARSASRSSRCCCATRPRRRPSGETSDEEREAQAVRSLR